ncbi:hypothetical protein Leryth_014056 [Lithospermum erythrorhizon]|nr:hypothetical protein Leryth_014056 [Lithospermum erythrorhizon]
MYSISYQRFIPTRPDPPHLFTRPVSLSPTRLIFPNPLKASAVKTSVAAASFYELLGVPESFTAVEIKQAYKSLARKYHPDVSPPGRVEEYTQRFIQVHEAYETLSDPQRRELYDKDVAFSSIGRYQRGANQQSDESEWKSRWQSQLSGLKNRSKYRDSGDNMSWGARIRQKREESNLSDG